MVGPVYPKFRKRVDGTLLLTDTEQARTASRQRTGWAPPSPSVQVANNAREKVIARHGDVGDDKDVLEEENVISKSADFSKKLGEYILQFGKYRGKCFRWLLENAPGYAGWIVAQMTKDEGKDDPSGRQQQANKAALKEYVVLFSEGQHILQMKAGEVRRDSSLQVSGLKSLVMDRRPLSPEQLQRRIERISSPPKFEPNIKERELIACVDEYDASIQSSSRSTASSTNVPVSLVPKAKRTLFQQGPTTLAPAPKTAKPRKLSTAVQPKEPTKKGDASTSSAQQLEQPAPEQAEQPNVIPVSVQSGRFQESATVTSTGILQSTTASSEPLLYEGWKSTLPAVDQHWVSKALFGLNANNKVELKPERVTQLWFEPPQPSLHTTTRNKVNRYFAHRLFLWMPVNIWGVKLICPHKDPNTNTQCSGVLTRSGIHQKTRLVLDIDSYYIIASEYLACSKCGKKLVAWAHNLLTQLDEDRQLLFPCILTLKLACDKKVVHLLRQRGLGNSSSSIHKLLEEAHSDRYLRNAHHYLTACRTYKEAGSMGLISTTSFEEPPVRRPVPGYRWLMKIYQLDVLKRLDFIKASMTSLFGTVLKMDSTKKITKKLAGRSAKTSMWATNVGNEHGQVIMTVMTASEGRGLSTMIQSLCQRFQNNKVSPPRILYVDRDCCGAAYVGKYFESWPFLLVRLDIWHFMRRLSVGCTTDAHPLYGTFMSRLSHCIFKWEKEDVELLKKAKKAEMIQQHIPDPSDADVVRHIKTDELSLHCRRMTRGTRETTTLITQLIDSLQGEHGFDILGVPLMEEEKMQQIWAQQSHHVACLQDPEGVQLYTRVGTLKKGGMELPKYRCARGSTSLESFHLHMNRFIPGTLANDVNFQVYLLDGVHRWNQDRQKDAVSSQPTQALLSYDGELRDSVNKLSNEVLRRPICKDFTLPGKHTGELIGLEYLYSQSTGASVEYKEEITAIENDTRQEEGPVEDEDEAFEEPVQVQDLTVPVLEPGATHRSSQPGKPLLNYPTEEEYKQMMDDQGGSNVEVLPAQLMKRRSEQPAPVRRHHVERLPTPSVSGQSEHSAPVKTQQTPIASSDIMQQLEHFPASTSTMQTKPIEPSCADPSTVSVCDESDLGPDNVSGYKAVTKLSRFLCSLHKQTESLSTEQASRVIQLWDALTDYDKLRTKFPQRFSAPGSGRFRSPKKMVALGVTSIERAVLGPNPTRASWPNCNRYVEAIVEQLLLEYQSDKRIKGQPTQSRWHRIMKAYACLQNLVINNARLMKETEIQLPSLNTKTITLWYNKKGKDRDQKILLQGIDLPKPPMTGSGAPAPKVKPETLVAGDSERFLFPYPQDTAGMAKLKVRQRKLPTQVSSVRPILPRLTVADTSSDLRFPFVAVPLQPAVSSLHMKRKEDSNQEVVRRKYTRTAGPVKCPKCGQDRLPPEHQQYMGYRYCAKTMVIPFEQWREDLKGKGAARKNKN